MQINGGNFSRLFEAPLNVNKGGLTALNVAATNNVYLTLRGPDFAAYQVPANFKFCIVGIQIMAIAASSTNTNYNIGYGDNATSTVAPTNDVTLSGFLPASVVGTLTTMSFYFEVPASKYPYFRSTSSGNQFHGAVIGYLQAV